MREKTWSIALKYILLTTICAIMMMPVLVAFLGSIRTNGEFVTRPFGLPEKGIQWENYTRVLTDERFWRSGLNSLAITSGVALLNVVLGSLMAFAFSRIKFFTRGLWFNILSIGLLFPLVVAILPIFIQIRSLNLTGTVIGIILPMAAFGLPGSVVILRGFFISIPRELEEASYIDGATVYQFFRLVLLPMARPVIFAVVTIQIIAAWNDFFLSLVVVAGNPEAWPLTLGLMQFQGQYGTDWSAVMAYICILIIPAVIFYLFTQKYIVTGLTGGELKG